MNSGSDYPECVLVQDGQEVIVRLNAPLVTTKPYSITVMVSRAKPKEWNFPVDADGKQIIKEFETYLNQ